MDNLFQEFVTEEILIKELKEQYEVEQKIGPIINDIIYQNKGIGYF